MLRTSDDPFDGVEVYLDVTQLRISQELNTELGSFINYFFKMIDRAPLLSQYEATLQKKRSRNPILSDYLDSLVVNISYLIETVDEYMIVFQECLKLNDADLKSFQSRAIAINTQYRNNHAYVDKYRNSLATHTGTQEEITDDIEYTYIFYSIYHEVCILVLSNSLENVNYFNKFRTFNHQDVGRIMKEYLHACTKLLLSQPAQLWVVPS